MFIAGKKASLLVDTGSSISLASTNVLHKFPGIKQHGKVEMPLTSEHVSPIGLPNGDTINVCGKISFPAILAKKKVHLTFYLVDNFQYSFLMGYKSLEKLHAVISFSPKLFSINPSVNVVLKQPIKIPPQTEIVTTAKVKGTFPNGFCGYFTPNIYNADTTGYVTPDTLAACHEGQIPICIANYNQNHAIYLHKSTKIGTFTGITKHDIIYDTSSPHKHNINTMSHSEQPPPPNKHHISPLTGKSIGPVSHLFDLSKSVLDDAGKTKFCNLLDEYRDIFAKPDNPIGHDPYFEYDLQLKPDVHKIEGKYYRLPPKLESVMKHKINQFLQQGIIEPSNSFSNLPCLLTKKPKFFKDDSLNPDTYRFILDARPLNKAIMTSYYPLPRCVDIIQNISKPGNTVWSSLDLADAFFQVGLSRRSRPLTSFRANYHSYQYTRIPQGVSQSPYFFQKIMDTVLSDLNFASAYQDDINAGSDSVNTHFEHLITIFERLRHYRLKLKIPKTSFFLSQLDLFGFRVTPDGSQIQPERVSAILELPIPKNKRDTKRILGSFCYFARFIPKYGEIAAPLFKLTGNKTKFKWGLEEQLSFDKLKECITKAPVLVSPDFNAKFDIYCDGSLTAIGAILAQNDHPIAFCNRVLTPTEKNLSTCHIELLAVNFALYKFASYIKFSPIVIHTDNKPLISIIRNYQNEDRRVQRYVYHLHNYNFELKHISGVNNKIADLLSRSIKPSQNLNMTS